MQRHAWQPAPAPCQSRTHRHAAHPPSAPQRPAGDHTSALACTTTTAACTSSTVAWLRHSNPPARDSSSSHDAAPYRPCTAGLEQYDPDGAEARELETAFGLTVLRHKEKKPAGSCTEAEQHFGCKASEMVMIGDRYLTDVVYGNRHGMLTVRVAPLTTEGEPYGVWAARAVEEYFVGRWSGAGEAGPVQELCADAQYSRFVRK